MSNTSTTFTRYNATRPTRPDESCPSTCTICFEPLSTSSSPDNIDADLLPEPAVTIKKCGHVFGHYCLTRWMHESNTCPVCRVDFFAMPEVATEGLQTEVGIRHFALGVYTVRNSRVEVSIDGGEQARTSLDVDINDGAVGRRDEEEVVGEGTWASGWVRRYYA